MANWRTSGSTSTPRHWHGPPSWTRAPGPDPSTPIPHGTIHRVYEYVEQRHRLLNRKHRAARAQASEVDRANLGTANALSGIVSPGPRITQDGPEPQHADDTPPWGAAPEVEVPAAGSWTAGGRGGGRGRETRAEGGGAGRRTTRLPDGREGGGRRRLRGQPERPQQRCTA